MVNSTVLILVAAFVVVISGLFAGAETGMYQLSRLRLRLGIERKLLSFVILGKCLRDSPALLLSMLIGTNLAHYLITSIVTYLLLSKVEAAYFAELSATFIAAPILFVFGELIPKNLFFYRADYLMPFFAPVLFVSHKLFSWCGAVPLLKFMSGIFGRLTGSDAASKTVTTAVQRPRIRAIFADIREEGVLSPVQTGIINRLVNISNTPLRAVMTPINKVEAVDASSDYSALLKKLKECAFTRLPVTDKQPANIVGFINIYEALTSPEKFTELYNFIKPIRKLQANTTVVDAINIMQRENQKIVLVTKTGRGEREKPIGIVTMKDLVEELLGELAEW
ncbi:MAG TPA: CNNM domain-containing protein [Sedimentisphaerales bacterium]|nr:CNNM domain-containing protein [Sedimentisphaerales bacterium]